jgi:hypothetical protein
MQQSFAASYWGFTFGITALATAPLRMVGDGDTAFLAPYLFVVANFVIGLISLGALGVIAQRWLLAQTAPASSGYGRIPCLSSKLMTRPRCRQQSEPENCSELVALRQSPHRRRLLQTLPCLRYDQSATPSFSMKIAPVDDLRVAELLEAG